MAYFKNTNLLPPVGERMTYLDTVDSTNNYAMQRIGAGLAAHGDIVIAARQTAGKGQRGKSWEDAAGKSLLMSIILIPGVDLSAQPLFLAAVAVAAARFVQQHLSQTVTIKWPNDILIEDKKAAGILIENVIQGSAWQWAIVGVGLNVAQTDFPQSLPYATSMFASSGKTFDIQVLAPRLATNILNAVSDLRRSPGSDIIGEYNKILHRRAAWQDFARGNERLSRKVLEMDERGSLKVETPEGVIEHFTHGSVDWIWE